MADANLFGMDEGRVELALCRVVAYSFSMALSEDGYPHKPVLNPLNVNTNTCNALELELMRGSKPGSNRASILFGQPAVG